MVNFIRFPKSVNNIGESGVMSDNAVVAKRARVAIFHYPVAIAT